MELYCHWHWYERELGWPTIGTAPPWLVTGIRFDVLDVPAEAGFAVLRRFPDTGPVALEGRRMRFLVAVGSADELPGLLDWLEWGGIPLDLLPLGSGGRFPAPRVPDMPYGPCVPYERVPSEVAGVRREAAHDRSAPVWLRPPEPGCEVEPSLPAMAFSAVTDRPPADGAGGAAVPVSLMPLVSSLATACHRIRLLGSQPCSFSYASRIWAGTRPRSLTS